MSLIAVVHVFCCNGLGPNALTLSDFIQMIWDQKPPVVVMLTRLFEKGKVTKYPIFSDMIMSIVIYTGVTFVEKVNKETTSLTNLLELTNLGHVDQVKLISLYTVQM